MFKFFIFFILFSILGFLTIWLKKEPGNISIEWHGWLLETSIPILIIGSITIFLLVTFIYIAIKRLFYLPKNIHKTITRNKINKATIALNNAFSAKSMNEIELAKKFSNKAKKLNNTPLKLLLDMDISEYYNDDNKNILTNMLSHSETKLLAIKKLTNIYIKENNISKAIETIQLTPKSNKTPNWFFYKFLQLNIIDNNWKNIFETLNHISKYTDISSKDYKILQGNIYLAKAINLNEANHKAESLDNVNQALKFIPSFPSAIVLKANLLHNKNPRLCVDFLKSSWKHFSHPDLANFICEINYNKTNASILKIIKEIIKSGNNNYNNNLLLAKGAIKANSWTTAREAINNIPKENWTKNTYIMMAELEKKENGNLKIYNEWLEKAEKANLDFIWGCTKCSHIDNEWKILCPKCFSLNSIKWQQFIDDKTLLKIKTISQKNDEVIINEYDKNKENAARGILGELNKGINN